MYEERVAWVDSGVSDKLTLRPASQVMNLDRLGSFHQSRLSFMRTLVRRIMSEQWDISRKRFDLDEDGYGTVIYEVRTPHGLYSFVLFSHYLDPEERNDRVIACQWDLTMALCEGAVSEEQLEGLRENVPKQEAGRVDARVFVLSRANRSARNFDYVVNELAAGNQPDLKKITEVGYLYRTTAVYGSGKLGMADWNKVKGKHADFCRPFAGEMFTCYMLRQFSLEQAEHIAQQHSPETAVPMDDVIKRYFGIGNSTGLGMAPYLINHPQLISQWIEMRETALARVRQQGEVTSAHIEHLQRMIQKAIQHLREITSDDERQHHRNKDSIVELQEVADWIENQAQQISSWSVLTQHVEQLYSLETQEILNSLLMELYPALVDDLDDHMGIDECYDLKPEMSLAELRSVIESRYDWALAIDFTEPDSQHLFWYRSMEKLEPRLGECECDIGKEKEMALAIGRLTRECYDLIEQCLAEHPNTDVVRFLLRHPAQKGIIRRIQAMSQHFYGDIQANLVDKEMLPIHLLRCKLSFFGVSKFDPRSKLWVRNTMFQGAPLLSDIGHSFADDWYFPLTPAQVKEVGNESIS
ncbi:MAG: hypothetical protein V7745_05905 [Pseudomonadales bacterium]